MLCGVCVGLSAIHKEDDCVASSLHTTAAHNHVRVHVDAAYAELLWTVCVLSLVSVPQFDACVFARLLNATVSNRGAAACKRGTRFVVCV